MPEEENRRVKYSSLQRTTVAEEKVGERVNQQV
jgi:hypothetical protein